MSVIPILGELEVKEEIDPDAHKSESELPDGAGKAKQKVARELALPRHTRGGGGKLLVYDTAAPFKVETWASGWASASCLSLRSAIGSVGSFTVTPATREIKFLNLVANGD